MATPPAPTAASVEAARIRASSSQMDNALEQLVRVGLAQRKSMDSELSALLISQRKLDEFIGKGQNDAFVKLADLNTEYGRAVAGGNVRPVDKLKYLVEVMRLQKDINVSLTKGNDERLKTIIAQAESDTGGKAKDPATNRRIWELFFQDASASAYNPTLVADVNELIKKTDVKDPLSFNIEGDTNVIQQYNDRIAAQQSLNNAAKVIETSFGPDALKNLDSVAGSGVISADVETKLRGIPDDEFNRLREVSKQIPGLTDLTARRTANDTRIEQLRKSLSGDLMGEIQTSYAKMTGGTDFAAKSRISAMARLVGRPKFQDWAASNGLKVGTTRPADRPGDKDLPGYDSATNTVYVPGPDDERAVRVAMRQSTLRPERQILPRRGLEPRKVLSVEVGEPSPDATKVNKDGKFRTLDGKYVTDAEIEAERAKYTSVAAAPTKDGVVLKMKDGSFKFQPSAEGSEPVDITADDPRVKAATFTDKVVAPPDDALGITEAAAPAPSATRTITGRETALLPSDPEGATVIETAEGRRIVIPKEQRVSVTEAPKVTPLEGETTYRGVRMPFAALRARMAGVKGEAAPTPTEAEVEALPEAGSVRAPAPVSAEVAGAPTIGSRVAPPLPTQPSVAVTPGEEAGKEVRDAAGAMTGATAPQPVGVANGGSKAAVPVMQTTPEENTRMAAIKARLEGRIREMRDARMQADKDVVSKAGIMPGQVPASDTMDKLKASGKLQNLPVTGATKSEVRLLPITSGQPVAQPVLLDQPSMLTPSSVGFAKSVVKGAGLLEGEAQMRQAEMTDEQRAEQRRQEEEDLKMLGVSSAKPSPSSAASQPSIDEARRKRIAQAAARKRAEDAARAGMEVPPPTMAPYAP